MSDLAHGDCDCGCGGHADAAALCGCCDGITSRVPRPTANRPGLDALSYRIGTHADFLESLKARLSTHVLPDDAVSDSAAASGVAPRRPLAALRTRAADDPAMALLDGWATVADVLTFYQERIANEGYLRTAIERRSVLALAALVGYAPRPGVAASAFLAYDIDSNATEPVTIPAGARVQSVPGPDEKPQTFETSDDLLATAAWSSLAPRRTRPQQPDETIEAGRVWLAGLSVNLAPGNPILIAAGGEPDLYRVTAVRVEPKADRTEVAFAPWTAGLNRPRSAAADDAASLLSKEWLKAVGKPPSRPLRSASALRGDLGGGFRPGSEAGMQLIRRASPELADALAPALADAGTAQPALEVFALRLAAGVFGRNAPQRREYRTNGELAPLTYDPVGEWPIVDGEVAHEEAGIVRIEGAHEDLLPGSWIVLDFSAVPDFDPKDVQVRPAPFANGQAAPYLVTSAAKVSGKIARAVYGVTGDAASIELDSAWLDIRPGEDVSQDVHDRDFQVVRGTAIYARSEALPLAEAPIDAPVCDGAASDLPLELGGLALGLAPGRYVIVSGERADLEGRGVRAAEVALVAEVVHGLRDEDGAFPFVPGGQRKDAPLPGERTHTFLRLERPLAYCYRRESLVIHGNVVRATHGETRVETLGSGDGAKALQTFSLKQPPLTYVSAPTAAGAESTLQVFVNDIRWREAPSFVDRGPAEPIYTLRRDDTEKTTITFGDGIEGARLPTGAVNLQAVYRTGLGRGGNVRASQLTTLQTRPQGVRDVCNPLRASGGADPETRDEARSGAALAVTALDRLVSVADHAAFARTFAGVGKAAAARLSDGGRNIVHVTIAGAADAPIDPRSDLYLNLRRALHDLGDPLLPVALAPRALSALVVSAGVRINPDRRWKRVSADIREALLDRFGFARRGLAEGVAASRVIGTMQNVPGVTYVDLDSFGAIPVEIADGSGLRPATPEETAAAIDAITATAPADHVPARPACRGPEGGVLPAELVMLIPDLPATLVINQIAD